MEKKFLPFSTSLIGSLPRSKELMKLRRRLQSEQISYDEMLSVLQKETEDAVRLQERNGIDIIVNGELERDNYVSFVAEKLLGVKMMNMGDMLAYIEDKKAFEQILNTLDVPSISIKNAICNGRIHYDKTLVSDEMMQLKKMTTKPVKATLPGPYLMTRSMWLPALSKEFYRNKEELGKSIVEVLKLEIDNMISAGTDIVQFDEPVLTEVVFAEGKTRSFMCAALSEKKDPTEELEFATLLIKEVIDYIRDKNIISSLHVCRGNWSKDESILLKGPYTPLLKLFEQIQPDVLALEFSTPRAGELGDFLSSTNLFETSILALGVINPRTDVVETSEFIVNKAQECLKYISKDNLWLNPDCGFATFANRPVSTMDIVEEKLKQLNRAKMELRETYV